MLGWVKEVPQSRTSMDFSLLLVCAVPVPDNFLGNDQRHLPLKGRLPQLVGPAGVFAQVAGS